MTCDDEVYQQLIEKQRKWIYGLPDSEYLLPLMKLRIAPEEASLLLQIPHLPGTIDQLKLITGVDETLLRPALDALAAKGLVMKIESSKGTRYMLHDAFFWFYRMPDYAGKRDDFNKKISPLLNRYYRGSMAAAVHIHRHKGLRTIPINIKAEQTQAVMPYEDVAVIIDASKIVCVSTCSCRHRKNLDPDEESCRHDTRTCLHFDVLGRYLIQNELGEEITKQEAHEISYQCADAGLVHAVSNTIQGIDTVCNCCSCCCAFIETRLILPDSMVKGHQPSNYIAHLDEEKCKACGLCAKRCPMKALTFRESNGRESKIGFSPEKCIGCAVCAHKCPTGAIRVKRREKEQIYPSNQIELAQAMLRDQGVI